MNTKVLLLTLLTTITLYMQPAESSKLPQLGWMKKHYQHITTFEGILIDDMNHPFLKGQTPVKKQWILSYNQSGTAYAIFPILKDTVKGRTLCKIIHIPEEQVPKQNDSQKVVTLHLQLCDQNHITCHTQSQPIQPVPQKPNITTSNTPVLTFPIYEIPESCT